jgi:GntR family transcriptional regulator
MLASGHPTQLADTHVALDLARRAGIDKPDTGRGGMYSRLADIGLPVSRFTEEVTCRPWTEREARALALDDGQPVFQIANTTWTTDGTPTSVTYHVMPGHQWALHYEWEAQ